MKTYELNCIISPDFSEEEIRAFQEKVRSAIQEEGGLLVEAGVSFRKRLGLSTKKRISGNLTNFVLQLEPEKMEGLKNKIEADPQIIRLIITVKKRPRLIKIPRGLARKTPPPAVEKSAVEDRKEEKVELKEIEKKLEEILGE